LFLLSDKRLQAVCGVVPSGDATTTPAHESIPSGGLLLSLLFFFLVLGGAMVGGVIVARRRQRVQAHFAMDRELEQDFQREAQAAMRSVGSPKR
jgi:hypothetical protein